jgi:hypothetical protein
MLLSGLGDDLRSLARLRGLAVPRLLAVIAVLAVAVAIHEPAFAPWSWSLLPGSH